MRRFKDQPVFLGQFLDEVWVQCPKCAQCAVIRNISNELPAVLHCTHCGYHNRHDKVFYDLKLNRNCPNCGRRFAFRKENVRHRKAVLRIACPHCGSAEHYHPNYIRRDIRNMNPCGCDDFFFHCPLWLQKSFKGKVFFAYNPRHLAYVKSFIAADIRERNDYLYRMWTHTTTLPALIKARKNRSELLRLIRQLEERCKDEHSF